MDQIREDLKEIKSLVIELVREGGEHNSLLRTHEARSIALQTAQEKLDVRISPIERHVHLINTLSKILVSMGSIVGVIIGIYKLRH